MDDAAARRLARALFLRARADRALDAVAADLRALAELVRAERRFVRLLDHPRIADADKARLVAGAVRTELVRNFVAILWDDRETAALPRVAERFAGLARSAIGRVDALARLPMALAPAEEERLRRALAAATGRAVDLTVEVDPALLGGVWLRVAGTVYDNTLRTALSRVRKELRAP